MLRRTLAVVFVAAALCIVGGSSQANDCETPDPSTRTLAGTLKQVGTVWAACWVYAHEGTNPPSQQAINPDANPPGAPVPYDAAGGGGPQPPNPSADGRTVVGGISCFWNYFPAPNLDTYDDCREDPTSELRCCLGIWERQLRVIDKCEGTDVPGGIMDVTCIYKDVPGHFQTFSGKYTMNCEEDCPDPDNPPNP